MGWFLGVFFSQSKIVFSECFLQTIGSLGCVYQKSVSSGCCFSKNVGSWMFVFLLSSKPIVGRGFFPHQNRSFRLRYKFFHVSHLSHVVGTPPTIAAASEKKKKAIRHCHPIQDPIQESPFHKRFCSRMQLALLATLAQHLTALSCSTIINNMG